MKHYKNSNTAISFSFYDVECIMQKAVFYVYIKTILTILTSKERLTSKKIRGSCIFYMDYWELKLPHIFIVKLILYLIIKYRPNFSLYVLITAILPVFPLSIMYFSKRLRKFAVISAAKSCPSPTDPFKALQAVFNV